MKPVSLRIPCGFMPLGAKVVVANTNALEIEFALRAVDALTTLNEQKRVQRRLPPHHSERHMNPIWPVKTINGPAMHVLHHWHAFQVRPTDICFIPLPGPAFAVFAGLVDYTGLPEITAKVVAFDPANRMLSTWSGKTYCLGPDAGFTPDMQRWYRQRMAMAAAGARDVTDEVLSLLEAPTTYETPSTTTQSRA